MTSSENISIDLNILPENLNPCSEQDTQNIESISNSTSMLQCSDSRRKRNFLSNQTKRSIYQMLLEESRDGKIKRGVFSKVAETFSVCRKTVSRIWYAGNDVRSRSGVAPDFSCKLPRSNGRKRVELSLEQIKAIPLRRRTNIRSLSKALGMSKSTIHRRIQEGYLRPHSNAVKPKLTEENKRSRLEFCLSMINRDVASSSLMFNNMHDVIHVDEKWFYISNTTQKYYLHQDESEPYRACKSKRFIFKVMFMAAVARPRFDNASNSFFDGKLGIWPFVYKEPAKRNSKNRASGTLETKPVASVTKQVIRAGFLENLLPAIREKWPSLNGRRIYIQQDNAKPHLHVNDPEFVEAARQDGFDIHLCCQPANSPDLNVLDLGFFRAIDSLQHQEAPSTIDELVLAVQKAYDIFPVEELNNVFLTLQSCMVEVMRTLGGNDYKIPHMNKKKLSRAGQLPETLECDRKIFDDAKLFLENRVGDQ
ncbi:uncharacterized protein LOC130990549 [Salvia miltiorrhiza]|uniref:uncharacterized protein LOC130990549 n=1 Tax=Salvia miltiorrhiza TaxID=226208 RepID=UPI0025AD2AAB|nr:uncharacterized protein LOC130990549 [Salvia miltiorrhiza]